MATEHRQFARHLRARATKAEDVLWQAVRGRRLAGLKFRRQVPLLAYTVDFLCIERRLIVELDGRHHGWSREYDAERTSELEARGFIVLRFPNALVFGDIDLVRSRIAEMAALAAGV
ncbi:endonuclease domain-containing protein [Labrys wisconsinensis]|uniref:Very-short-patch-repair endonuclease n=1 Tax=Labrys wisconsinensis TaxID=425677 RepID=A0ABU0JJT7_9HYPH|nr:DUF559 domain-containing protein [Labrys wisconsinensis]MDQ0474549.1 very-short-patch-repair endonuclease [Labrys wisconsinensis]